MRSSYPGKIIANLIIIRGVVPGQPVYRVVSVGRPRQINIGDAAVDVDSVGEDLRHGESGRLRVNTERKDVDAVPIVVEANLLMQIGTNLLRPVLCKAK